MLRKGPNRLQLIDAFSVLAWADIVEATAADGHFVQIQDRGYDVDRVKVRSANQFVADVKTSQLKVRNESLDFVGDHVRGAFIVPNISPDMFVRLKSGYAVPKFRHIEIPKEELNEIRQAIAVDVKNSFENSATSLQQYLELVERFCISWNAGNVGGLSENNNRLSRFQAGNQLANLSDRLYHCLQIFQNFYLSYNNFTAANKLFQTASGSKISDAMAEKLANAISVQVSKDIDAGALRDAAELAALIPEQNLRQETLSKIDGLSGELSHDLERAFREAINAYNPEEAKRVLNRARNGAVTKLDSTAIDRLASLLDSILNYPGSGLVETVEQLDSAHSQASCSEAMKGILRERASLRIDNLLQMMSYDDAISTSYEAVEKTHLIKKRSPHWETLRSSIVTHLKQVLFDARIFDPDASATFAKLKVSLGLFQIFEIDHSLVTAFINSQIDTFRDAFGQATTDPKKALAAVDALAPLSGYIESDFPFEELRSFLKNLASRDITRAHYIANDLSSFEFPIAGMLTQATEHAAQNVEKQLDSEKYFEARKFYYKRISAFRKHSAIRARLISAFRKSRRKKELAFFERELKKASRFIFAQTFSFEASQPELAPRDYELIAAWNNLDARSLGEDPLDALVEKLGKFRALQHFSARSAERVALEIYQKLHGRVFDLSIDQVSGKSKDWIYADVRTQTHDNVDRYIDVKSARSSFSRENRYSEFCVKQFKTVSSEVDVHLSGFFSQYKTLEKIDRGDNPTYSWLGELSKMRLEMCTNFIHEKFGSIFCVEDFRRNVGDAKFVPGWLFDYPEAVYMERNRHIKALKPLLSRARSRSAVPTQLPEAALILACPENPVRDSPSEQLISNALRRMVTEVGLDRGLLFMNIIAISLTAMRRNTTNFTPGLFRRFLFIDECEGSKLIPLGISDPLGYIDELIECLDTVFKNSRKQILDFRTFKLIGHGILQGKSAYDTHWTTILAYCGGWDQDRNVRCGNTPLVLGAHESCRLCRKLVCDRCGFCADGCQNCYSRSADGVESLRGQNNDDQDIPF